MACSQALPTAATQPNSGYFIAAGAGHCIIPSNALYSAQADGVRAIDWLAGLVDGPASPQVVDCLNAGECTAQVAKHQRHQPVAAAAAAAANAGAPPRCTVPPLGVRGSCDAWSCAHVFSLHYRALGLPQPNTSIPTAPSNAHILRMFEHFAAHNCSREGEVVAW